MILELDQIEAQRVLVASDCLSEGVNLQHAFDAVLHYDLSWNPTRHEQREGRVDRFGQSKPVVRAVMLYGENNPVDGAVLRVVLHKAEKIQRETGVAVPLPADNNKVTQALVQEIFLHEKGPQSQLGFDFGDSLAEMERGWESMREKAKASRTVFAQRSLHPEEVLPEWQRAITALGGEGDVERFVRMAANRFGAPLQDHPRGIRFPILALPAALRERLSAQRIVPNVNGYITVSFRQPPSPGSLFVHRTHPLVATLAEYAVEIALAGSDPERSARCGVVVTSDVATRTILMLFRLRCQIASRTLADERLLLAEECLTVAAAADNVKQLTAAETLQILSVTPARNATPEERARQVAFALDRADALMAGLNEIAEQRAQALLDDHRRVRAAADARGWRYQIQANTPMDLIGVYVLVPAPRI
jgi:hypothetical protein